MAKLIFSRQNQPDRVYKLVLEKTTVGRGDQNTLVIADGSLSAVHCEILLNGSEVIIRDLGSRNGTFVNGAKLSNQQSQIKSGQTVRFGSVEARLELDEPPTDDSLSEETAVHSMGRIMREQKRERERPKPDAAMKLESLDSSPDTDRTVTSVALSSPRESSVPSAPTPAVSQPGKPSRATAILIAVVLASALIVLLWLWMRGK